MTEMNKLTNKVAFVTGASKGIGAGIAKELALAGATVIVNYSTSRRSAEEVVTEILAGGGQAWAVQGDFSNENDIRRVYAEIKTRHSALDIVVNNAGVYSFHPIEETNAEEFHRLFNLNVLGLLFSIKAALPLFPADGGSIINIGSTAGRMSIANGAVYCATKSSIDSISIALSKELGGRRIRVNALNPGVTVTEGTIAGGIIGSEFETSAIKSTPLGRAGRPQDIGRIAAFLASDDAFWITGQLIYATGGLTM
jgi:3-oxoacyl-[acyl-carrier protein] reductase